MEKLFEGLRHFVARDLVYIISGSAVVGAFLYLFNRLPRPGDSWPVFVLLAGIGYFIAYALQDALSLTPILTTTNVQNPSTFVKWLYKRFERKEWSDLMEVDLDKAREQITEEAQLARHERIVTLMQIGTTGGPCMALSGILFFARWSLYRDSFDLWVSIMGVVLALTLICLGWLKAAQKAQFIAGHGSG